MAEFVIPLYFNLDTFQFTDGLTGSSRAALTIGQSDVISWPVRFVRSGVAVELTNTPVFTCGLKLVNAPSSAFLVQTTTGVKTGTGSSTVYTFTTTISSSELDTQLNLASAVNCGFVIYDSANGIATLPSLKVTVLPNPNISGSAPTSANGTWSLAAGKTFTVSNTITLTGTDGLSANLDRLANLATNKVLGRTTASTGAVEELPISGTGSVAMTNGPTFSGLTSTSDIAVTGISSRITTSGANGNIEATGGGSIVSELGSIQTNGPSGIIATSGDDASISTSGEDAHIYTNGNGSYIQTSHTFNLSNGTHVTTLSHAPTANRAIVFPDAAGTLALTSDITGGTLAGSFLTLAGTLTNVTGILRGLAAQETVASYNGVTLTGTMYFADATARVNGTLTGIGTLFSSEAKVGDRIATASDGTFGAQGGPFFVKSIASNTSLTLTNSGNAAQIGSGNAVSAKIFRSILTAQSAAGLNLVTISADGTFILGTPPASLASGAIAAAGANATFKYVTLADNRLYSSGGWRSIETYNGSANVDIGLAESGTTRVHILSVASTLAVTLDTTLTGLLTANGGITVIGGAKLLTTNSALTNYMGANTATLDNSPITGDPTKWIAIDDDGTTRYIPTWS